MQGSSIPHDVEKKRSLPSLSQQVKVKSPETTNHGTFRSMSVRTFLTVPLFTFRPRCFNNACKGPYMASAVGELPCEFPMSHPYVRVTYTGEKCRVIYHGLTFVSGLDLYKIETAALLARLITAKTTAAQNHEQSPQRKNNSKPPDSKPPDRNTGPHTWGRYLSTCRVLNPLQPPRKVPGFGTSCSGRDPRPARNNDHHTRILLVSRFIGEPLG
ncbi:hypothetical protein STEG23_033282 [Scotinomys teguina]